MADNDDAAPARQSMAKSPTPHTTQISSFTSINKHPTAKAPPPSAPLTSSPPNATRINGASALHLPAESHPMTATSSSSSLPSDQQNGGTTDTNGASPYGTRSRNRGGNTRPNYAEDRDADLDFDYTSNKKPQAAVLPAAAYISDIDKSSGSNTRRSSNTALPVSTHPAKLTSANASKDNLPGMSSFSVNPESSNLTSTPAPSRKRKAPGAAPVNQTPSVTTHPAATATSRRATSTLGVTPSRTSNLMTFENCQCYLRNGKLRADDGTLLSIDGTCKVMPCFHRAQIVTSSMRLGQR